MIVSLAYRRWVYDGPASDDTRALTQFESLAIEQGRQLLSCPKGDADSP